MDSSDSDGDIFTFEGTINKLRKFKAEFSEDNTVTINLDKDEKENSVTVIDSDENDSCCIVETEKNSPLLNVTDPLEIEETIKVVFPLDMMKIHRFTIKWKDKLLPIFESLAEMKSVTIDEIDLVIHSTNRVVSPYDTLHSLNYEVTQIFNAYVKRTIFCAESKFGTGNVEIRCILPTKKSKPFIFFMYDSQPLDILLKMCSRELNCKMNDFKLVFDGETVLPTDTCKNLDLVSGDSMEIHFKKNVN